MSKKAVFGIVLTLLVVGTLTSAFNSTIAGVDGVIGEGELSSSASSEPPSLVWSKTYGGDADDEAYCVRQTSDEGYILVGYTYSFGAGNTDIWLVKTDLNGNMEWNRTYGGADLDWGCSVQQTSDGGYIIAGGSYSFSKYPRFYLVKTDSGGNLEWNKTYSHGAAHTSLGSFIQQTSDGGYIFAGGHFPLTKTDANGNVEWYKDVSFPSGYESWAESVQQTSDGGYMVAGTVWYPTPIGDYHSCWLVKTNASGNIEWNKLYGGTKENEGAHYGQQTTDGGYMLAGWFIPPGEFRPDYLLVKTDANGNMEWNRTYGGEYKERAYSGQQTSDGGYILAGWGDIASSPSFRVWLVKTNLNGNMEWNATYGGDAWAGRAVQQTSEDEYLVAGFTQYYHMGGKDRDVFLMKLGIKHDIAVTDVQPSNNVVPQNHSVSVNVTVENQGDATETFNVTAYTSTTAIATFTDATLMSGNSSILTFTWNTTGFKGVYILSAAVTSVSGEVDTADNTYVYGPVIVGTGPPGNLIWVNPPLTDNLQESNTFVVDLMINITDPDGPGPATGLTGFEYKLGWEPTKIDIVDITYHAPWPTGQWFLIKNKTGVAPDGKHYHWLALVATSLTGFIGTKSLCTYTFYVNYQPYYPDPDYNGRLNIYDDKLTDDTATSFAHTTYDGHYCLPSKVPVHDVAITGIVLSKTVVGQGLSMYINVTVANEGDLPESFSVTGYCNTTPIATQAIILAAGDSTTITFTWNTTGFAKGNYTISANATIVPDETDTADNSYTDGTVRVNIVGDVVPEYGVVDIVDLVYVAIHFGAKKGEPEYEPNADIISHGIIDIVDIVIVAIHFGETDSQI